MGVGYHKFFYWKNFLTLLLGGWVRDFRVKFLNRVDIQNFFSTTPWNNWQQLRVAAFQIKILSKYTSLFPRLFPRPPSCPDRLYWPGWWGDARALAHHRQSCARRPRPTSFRLSTDRAAEMGNCCWKKNQLPTTLPITCILISWHYQLK